MKLKNDYLAEQISEPSQGVLKRVVRPMLFALLMLMPLTSAWSAVITALSPITYQVSAPDLSVKVWGGSVVIQRGYFDNQWYPNLNWLPLQLSYDNFDGSVKTLTRGRTDYNKVAPGVYQDQYYNLLRQTGTGFRWNDRHANWIEYNPAGEIKAFGDRNGSIATFQYSGSAGGTTTTGAPASEGHITGIQDHFGAQALWFDYDTNQQLIRIRDTTNRKVEYQTTTPAAGTQVHTVIDTNGNTWTDTATTGVATSIAFTDPESHTTIRSWYSNGAPASTTYADGNKNSITQDYDAAKGIFYYREVSPGGKVTETWSDLKQDISRGDYLRRDINGTTVAKQSLDTATRTTTTTDARGLNTAVSRDQWGNITKTVYPDGATVTTQYDGNYGNILQHTDENGTVTQNTYDTHGNLIKTVEAAGLAEQRSTDYTYNADGQRTSMNRRGDATTPDAVTQYAYDTHSNLTSITDAEGGITKYTYDVMGNVLTKLDARGKLWKRTYDNLGNLISVTDPLNRTTRIGYDKTGLPISLTDAANNLSTLGYDAVGKLLSITDPYGAVTRYGYDAAGNLTQITDSENHTRRNEYDLDDRLIKQIDGNNNLTQYQYGDAASGLNRLLTQILYPTLSQSLQYDQRDRITRTTDAATGTALPLDGSPNQITQHQYDRVGNLITATDPANRSTSTQYNAYGQATKTTDASAGSAQTPAGGLTQYGYDPRGNLTSVTDAKGNTHQYQYDKLDRLVKETRPLGQAISYTYDPVGNLIQVTDALGQIKQYLYDAANRRIREDHYLNAAALTAQTAVKSTTYSYNTLDRLTSYADSSTSSLQASTIGTYTYDAKQLRKVGESINYAASASSGQASTGSAQAGFTLATSTSYNSLGQKSSTTYPDGAVYSYTYDSNNQLNILNLPTGYGSITINSYLWSAPAQITLPGGTVRSQTFDGLLRLKDLNVKDPGQSQVMSYQYRYDATNNIVAKATEAGTTNYSYDTLDRLTGANYTAATGATATLQAGSTGSPQGNEAYSYDPVANRLTQGAAGSPQVILSYTYNENNQLLSAGGSTGSPTVSYSYDANGNTVSQSDSNGSTSSPQARNYVYDTSDRLVEVRDGNNALIAVYSYDPFGRRLSKDTGTRKTFFLYNEEGLIAEADASGQLTKSYGYAPGSTYMTNPLWMKSGNGLTGSAQAYYAYQNDHLGTPQKLLTQSGQTVWSATYDAFGNATIDAAYTIVNNLRNPGQYYDAETNLHYNWMRYYDPKSGRYWTSDPIGLYGGINLYVYGYSNSMMFYDPYGLFGMADMPTIPQGVVDFSAGFGDTLSFGITNQIRNLMGTNIAVDKCSSAYGYGEASGVGLSLAFGAAHLGRGGLNQMNGNLGLGIGRIFSDGRKWGSVQRTWSKSVGGYKGEYQLHHWFTPQSAGVSNAIWNYLPISAKLNNMMSDGGVMYNAFKGLVLGIYGAAPTALISNASSNCGCK